MIKWLLKIMLISLLCIVFCGCVSEGMKDAKDSMNEAYSKIVLDDGVDENEASILAETYFTWYISGCGATGDAIDSGESWEIKTVIGVAAKPYKSIFVNKKTGMITCSKGPTIESPK